MRTVAETISGGDAGAFQTLTRMQSLVNSRVAHPMVRGVAVAVAREAAPRDLYGQAQAIRDYLSEHVQFLADPAGIELLHDPVIMLTEIARAYTASVDCDDVAILGAALGKAVGLRARFVAVGFFNRTNPLSHVWAELATPRGWLDLDTTRGDQGITVPMIARAVAVPV